MYLVLPLALKLEASFKLLLPNQKLYECKRTLCKYFNINFVRVYVCVIKAKWSFH